MQEMALFDAENRGPDAENLPTLLQKNQCPLYTPCWNRNLIAPKVPFAPLWILIEEPHSMSGFEY